MDALVMAAQLILGLSILVGLHELGHLLAAKLFGMRVEQYSIGFPPKIFGIKWGETEYSLGALPLGGYVKISGMVDESLDTENLKEEPKPYEFRSKPAWQRLIVMMGGIIVNVITGILIFVFMVYHYGESYLPKDEVNKYGIVAHDLGKEVGFRTGDRILAINGRDFERFGDVTSPDVLFGDNAYYTVLRDGDTIDLAVPSDFLDKFTDKEAAANFIEPRRPFMVAQVMPGTPADSAGLQAKDKIIAVDGQSISYFDELVASLQDRKSQFITIDIEREGQVISKQTRVTEEGTLGFGSAQLLNFATINYTFGEAIPRGAKMAFDVVWLNVRAFGKIFSGEVSASKSISGPIGIAQIFGGTWDWANFWRITGLLSMILAFMNFLPIPALDGGHVAFLTYEMVSGRKPSDKFLETAQKVGMVLLLGIMAFAIFNDVFKYLF
jgi:regulator of sigma E protease